MRVHSELVGRRVVGAAHLREMHALLRQFLHPARGEMSVAAGSERLVFATVVSTVGGNHHLAPFLPNQRQYAVGVLARDELLGDVLIRPLIDDIHWQLTPMEVQQDALNVQIAPVKRPRGPRELVNGWAPFTLAAVGATCEPATLTRTWR